MSLRPTDSAGKQSRVEIPRGVYPALFQNRDCFADTRNDLKRCGARNDLLGQIATPPDFRRGPNDTLLNPFELVSIISDDNWYINH
jgi:hypothetical protein